MPAPRLALALLALLFALLLSLDSRAGSRKGAGERQATPAKTSPAAGAKGKKSAGAGKKPARKPAATAEKGPSEASSRKAAASPPGSKPAKKAEPRAGKETNKTEKTQPKSPPARSAKSQSPKKAVVRDEPEVSAAPAAKRPGSRLTIPPRAAAERARAYRYANLDELDVLAELARRGIPWVPASPPLPGVRTPIRLTGPLHGVTIHSTLPEAERAGSPFEILDARLALALDDFCALLARHDVVEIVHYTMYRPPAVLPPDLNRQIRHPAGLAIDVGALRKRDGRWLAVGPHWPSDIGAKTCGEGAREHWARAGRELVSIACEAADEELFHFILTPHFDAAHADHLHLEIKPDTRWFLFN